MRQHLDNNQNQNNNNQNGPGSKLPFIIGIGIVVIVMMLLSSRLMGSLANGFSEEITYDEFINASFCFKKISC